MTTAQVSLPFFFLLTVASLLVGATTVPTEQSQLIVACGTDVEKLVLACHEFIAIPGPKKKPNKACCDSLATADVPCLCKELPPEVEKSISMEKAVYVARSCGKTVPAGTKCGSYTVPPSGAPAAAKGAAGR
ncbi:uncharacterized protein LOC122002874 [Zingiber officinale]|uniref:Bifunctional inhibitor/plant lipid transfer protein/seed storage helical domain-containing protein n=1 Tax=Zingiber officinale TaxID=94328 RepID=A0A8J5IJI3_ZINOF|nr:uncharacterized protein LOC122002874 [Zingiber officinale]KAG6536270.1 hypothetical protein ZIOFF_001321 [Zingiber officinale]